MSRVQSDYTSNRVDVIIPGAELQHPSLTDFGGNTVTNVDGQYLDLHSIPVGLPNWDYVINQNMKEVANRLYQLSLRIAKLYHDLGVQDPAIVQDANSPWAQYTTGIPTEPTTYHAVNPDGSGRISNVSDGSTAAAGIARLQSIIGTRSFSGSAFPNRNGWMVPGTQDGFFISYGTTITHNLDQLDYALGQGSSSTPTGYTDFNTFWNAKSYRDGEGVQAWSIVANIELLNRAIGSRKVSTSTTGNLNHTNELAVIPLTGYGDSKQTVTDSILDLDLIIGNRSIGSPAGLAFGRTAQWAIVNKGGTEDTTTITTMLSNLNTAIGHRVINNITSQYILKDFSGQDITAALNRVNNVLGDFNISETGDYYAITPDSLALSADGTVSKMLKELNLAIGSRDFTNVGTYRALAAKGRSISLTSSINEINNKIGETRFNNDAYYALQPYSESASMYTLIDKLNTVIGNRTFTPVGLTIGGSTVSINAQVISSGDTSITTLLDNINMVINNRQYTWSGVNINSGESITKSIELLNQVIGNRSSFAKTDPNSFYIFKSYTPHTVTLIDMFDKVATEIGNRVYTNATYISTGETIVDSLKALDAGIKTINTNTSLSNVSATAGAFYGNVTTTKEMFEKIGLWSLVSTSYDSPNYRLYSRNDATGARVNGVPAQNGNGWFDNDNAGTIRAIVQQLIDRIDSITGFDG